MRLHPRVLVLGLALPVLVGAPAGAGESVDATATPIRAEDLRRHLDVLASDAFEGRDTTEAGGAKAAEYVAASFRRSGLVPKGDDGGWFQAYTVAKPVLGPGNALSATTPSGDVSFVVEKDWNPFSVSASADVSGPLVFAGFGITAPKRSWDDYAGIDVKGKVVLVLRRNPGWDDVEHSTFLRKLANAAEHGAAAVLLCNDAKTTADGRDVIGHWSAGVGAPTGSAALPYAFVTQAAARRLLEGIGTKLEDLDAGLRSDGPRSAEVPRTTVRIATRIGKAEKANARNVIGFLPGRDPDVAEEVVVVGAHFDHVGFGYFGSLGGADAAGRIHNGADDNASGTAVLLELAEWFGAPANRPRRSLLFLAFSGEELGLLGSEHYVAHPTLPLDDVSAMVNLDMVGRCRETRLEVGGVGTGEGLQALVDRFAQGRFSVTYDPQGVAPTDSTSFFVKKVPVLWFFTGLHDDYHRPSDDADKIDCDVTGRVAELVRDVVKDLGERADRVRYTDPPPVPRPPVLGIAPGGESDPRGISVRGVTPGGPSEAAGLRAGDVIVSIAGTPVRNVGDLRQTLGKLEAGKTVPVVVMRGDERMTFDVVLGERPR